MPIQQPILLAFLVILSNLSLFIDIASLDFLRLILVDLLVVLSNFVLYLLEDAIIWFLFVDRAILSTDRLIIYVETAIHYKGIKGEQQLRLLAGIVVSRTAGLLQRVIQEYTLTCRQDFLGCSCEVWF